MYNALQTSVPLSTSSDTEKSSSQRPRDPKSIWFSRITQKNQDFSHLLNTAHQYQASRLPPKFGDLEKQQEKLLNAISNAVPFFPYKAGGNFLTNDSRQIEWLKSRGYISLAEKLSLNKGYPWNEIRAISCPALMEQIADLTTLCQSKKIPEDKAHQLLKFGLHLANQTKSSYLKEKTECPLELQNEIQHILGQLIFFVNVKPQIALECLDEDSMPSIIDKLNQHFAVELDEACSSLHSYEQRHALTQLQSPEAAMQAQIPKEIAKILITENGSINTGIIDYLSDVFLSPKDPPLNFQINLAYALKLLKRSPKLRAEFDKVHLPASETMLSNDVIRASLNLSNNEPITLLHAKQTILAALLSHLRQTQNGPCFATSLAIEMLSSHLGFCFKDLRQLLHESKQTRNVNHVQKDIPFMRRIHDEQLKQTMTVDDQGYVLLPNGRGAPLWDAPGLQAACQALGIADKQGAIMSTLNTFPLQNGQRHIEIYSFLRGLCSQADPVKGVLFDRACFAFSSQTVHPLLKVWENSIASMAEAREGGMVKKAIIQALMWSFQHKLTQLKIPPSKATRLFLLSLQKLLFENINLQYDPSIGMHTPNSTAAKDGGFVTYYHYQRIDTHDKFKRMIQDVLVQFNTDCLPKNMPADQLDIVNQLVTTLTFYAKSDEFIIRTLQKYHPSNKELRSLDGSHDKLTFTPWITQTGNNSKTVMHVYLENERSLQVERLSQGGAEERLIKIIQMAQKMPLIEKNAYLANPNKLAQFRIPGLHAGSLMLGHPTLTQAWQNRLPAKAWIDQHVLEPGVNISNSILDEMSHKRIIGLIQQEILTHYTDPEKILLYQEALEAIPNGLPMKSFRQAVMRVFSFVDPALEPRLDQIVRQLDTTLYQSLGSNLKEGLEKSAVHFADTNWSTGTQDVHLCFVVNPGTGNLEVWQCCANGTQLMALDQKYWLINREWEFLHLRHELVPNDLGDSKEGSR